MPLAAAAIFLLVLSRAMDQARAIRLDAETRASVSGSQTAIDVSSGSVLLITTRCISETLNPASADANVCCVC